MKWLVLIGFALQLLQLYGIYTITRQRKPKPEPLHVAVEAMDKVADEQPEPFAVDAKPRSIPWPIRRKELRDRARTRRAKLEEWRDA